MKTLTKIGLSVLIAVGFPFLTITSLLAYSLKGYPSWVIVTSDVNSDRSAFYINGKQRGDSRGLCLILREDENVKVSLVRDGKEQFYMFSNKWKFKADGPQGSDLGLRIEKTSMLSQENLLKCVLPI